MNSSTGSATALPTVSSAAAAVQGSTAKALKVTAENGG
jgi:hypothetical protein